MNRRILLACSILVLTLLAGCQSAVAPAPINATYDYAGPPTMGEPVNFEDKCLLPAELYWAFTGDMEGLGTVQLQIMHDGLCEPDTQYCDYNEKWVAEGVYEGEIKGQAGTFDFFLVATVNDCHFIAQMAIEPGSGTGELAGINGIINFDEEPGDEAPWPVSGYVYFGPSQAAPVAETTTEPALDAEIVVALEAIVNDGMAEIGIPGVTLAVVMDGEPVYLNGFGVMELGSDQPVTPETGFHLASTSKTVTGTAIMQLVEEGKIDLDSPLTTYLPDFTMADPGYADVTIRQLLSHTAGMPDGHDWVAEYTELRRDDEEALAEMVGSLSAESLLFAPGEDWNYSSYGFNILGHVVSNVSGVTFEEYVDEHIFTPLGMEQTSFYYEELDPAMVASPHVLDEQGEATVLPFFPYSRAHAPSSMLNSNAEDMAHYMAAHLNRGEFDSGRILNPESYDESWSTHGETYFGPPEDLLERYYGLGWTLGEYAGQPIYSHVGLDPGFNSFMALAPDKSMAFFIAANRGNTDPFDPPVFPLRGPILDLLLGIETED